MINSWGASPQPTPPQPVPQPTQTKAPLNPKDYPTFESRYGGAVSPEEPGFAEAKSDPEQPMLPKPQLSHWDSMAQGKQEQAPEAQKLQLEPQNTWAYSGK
jgi:hypothetical protein